MEAADFSWDGTDVINGHSTGLWSDTAPLGLGRHSSSYDIPTASCYNHVMVPIPHQMELQRAQASHIMNSAHPPPSNSTRVHCSMFVAPTTSQSANPILPISSMNLQPIPGGTAVAAGLANNGSINKVVDSISTKDMTLNCLLSETSSNVNGSLEGKGGANMSSPVIFVPASSRSRSSSVWNFGSSATTTVSSGESENGSSIIARRQEYCEEAKAKAKERKLDGMNKRSWTSHEEDVIVSEAGGFRKVVATESSDPPMRSKKRRRSQKITGTLPCHLQNQYQNQQRESSSRSTNISFQLYPPGSSSSSSPTSSSNITIHHQEEPDQEAIAQMKEMIYRAAAFRPVNLLGLEVVEKPRRKNVRISSDPQTVAARQRRERIGERIRVLQRLVPGGTKMDTASMLDEAANYLKFLQSQIKALETSSFPLPSSPSLSSFTNCQTMNGSQQLIFPSFISSVLQSTSYQMPVGQHD